MTEDSNQCARCGAKLAPQELGDVCPRCLLESAAEEGKQDTEPAADFPTLAPASTSVTKPATSDLPEIPGYRVEAEIARGGMGIVYRAEQEGLSRQVAVKMLLAGRFASNEEVERFRTEASAAAALDHPVIVPIFEVGEHAGHHFFSMAFVKGEALDRRLESGPLSPMTAGRLLFKLAEAVSYAHKQGVVHRDLKPGNVLIDSSGDPRITDFGLAKRLDGQSQLTATGQTLGTPSYMAPEQAMGKPDAVGPAADVYALGAILYATLTGEPPFVGDTPLATMMMVLEKEPSSPAELNPECHRDLATICLKCLAKDPQERYESAQALAEDLERFVNGQPILAQGDRGLGTLLRWYRTVQRSSDVRIRSQRKLFGLPWVDIAFGRDLGKEETEGHARGIFAFGDKATGVFAYGGVARGIFAFGARAYGVFAFGALAVGIVTCGLCSIGCLAAGGLAIGGFAFGFLSIGYFAVGFISFGWTAFGQVGRSIR